MIKKITIRTSNDLQPSLIASIQANTISFVLIFKQNKNHYSSSQSVAPPNFNYLVCVCLYFPLLRLISRLLNGWILMKMGRSVES